jgi:multidrug efflux system membrane fusion protein
MAVAKVNALRAQLVDMSLKAPFAGRIAARHAEVGEYAPPGKPIYTLLAMNQVKVTIGVPEAKIDAIREGAAATIVIDALSEKKSIPGRISRIGLQTESGSPLFPVEVTAPNPGERLRAGMVARVDIAVQTHAEVTVLEVPWVQRRGGRHYVFLFAPLEQVWEAVKAAHHLDDGHLRQVIALAARPADVGAARQVELRDFAIHGSSYVLFEKLPDLPLIVRGGHLLEDLSLVRTGILKSSATLLAGTEEGP